MTPEKAIEELENEIHLVEYVDGLYAENISLELLKSVRDLIDRQQAEIERLEKIRKADNNLITSLNKCYETAKAEAYKEFAEKLKEKCYEDFQETYEMLSPYVTDDDIDNLLKEMEGE